MSLLTRGFGPGNNLAASGFGVFPYLGADADSVHYTFKENLCHYSLEEGLMHITLKDNRCHFDLDENRMHYYIDTDDNVLITPDYLIDIGDGTYLLANGADYLVTQ